MKFERNGEPASETYRMVREGLECYSIDYLKSVVDVLGNIPLEDDERKNGPAYMSLAAKYLLIPRCDEEMIRLIAERMKVCVKIGKFKKERGLPIFVPEREAEILRTKEEMAQERGLPAGLATKVFTMIMAESRRLQEKVVV